MNKEDCIIRKAEKEDIEKGLLEVYIEGYKHHQKGRPDVFVDISNERFKEDVVKLLNENSVIVYVENDKVLGYLQYKIKESKASHVKRLNIDQLVVTENKRGIGIGKKLMEHAEDIAKNENCKRIELSCWIFNQEATDMYEHIGFKKQCIVYEKDLNN